MPVQKQDWGSHKDKAVFLFTLTNKNGYTAKVTNYGGYLADMIVPDKAGNSGSIILGYPDLDGYVNDTFFLGSTVGRFANRIANGKFTLEGKEYTLPVNNPPNHLHGGPEGFHTQVFDTETYEDEEECGVILKYKCVDGEAGFPGTLDVTVTYALTEENELRIDYEAECDKATPINLTNHAYWNLAGSGLIYEHELKLLASRYLPVDETAIPLGSVDTVDGLALDFTEAKKIGLDIGNIEGGFDHCFVIDDEGEEFKKAAELTEAESGRMMEIWTNKPGIQFYSGNFLEGKFEKHAALCLETQFFPDAPNKPDFPSCILNPGEVYRYSTIHRFSVE